MISRQLAEEVIHLALSTGGDYAEVFVENTMKNTMILTNGTMDSAVTGQDFGASVRVLRGTECVYAYTNDVSRAAMLELAKKVAHSLTGISQHSGITLVERYNVNYSPTLIVPSSMPTSIKVDFMRKAYEAARSYSDKIVQAVITYKDMDQKILLATSEGYFGEDRRIYTSFAVRAVASDGTMSQTGNHRADIQGGLELFHMFSPEKIGRDASQTAVTMLYADASPVGELPVVIANGTGGIFFHEACGHSLESSSVARGGSIFSNKIGERIATSKVTAYDDGTMPGEWGTLNVDDEGLPSTKNLLIEDGILRGYMIDRLGSRMMGMPPTGCGRKESYRFSPTSRMTNTYIAPGTDEDKDIIGSVEYGVYAKLFGGGTANPQTSAFNFSVQEAYLIENGEITKPIRGATIMGMGVEALMNVEMVGKDLAFDGGLCGAASGSLPVSNGQPMIKISKLVVGGK
ncbi:TldD/PmbA family protein [Paenibacillus endoradicis]|uniref:TldD/PmbA family protein n=1 Tax=Paenibacillus endoradicis TaxID=2972487 RepID=UPI00215918BA|nr:TldD/PmbA family protein [Paenibacillus endoradicis]MCR8656789.1 TldD/PmbA family protein [Paenibacillus endoradicis]